MYSDGYPTARFTYKQDNSGASTGVLFSPVADGLNVPFAFILAERGEPGAIYFGGAAELTPLLGASTFDPSAPYYNASTQFIGTAMAAQGVEVMRLVDPAAETSTLALFLTLTHGPIVQYKKNPDGSRQTDNQGNFIPRVAADGTTQITEPGVVVKWSARPLTSAEASGTLTSTSVTTGGVVTSTTYPILDTVVTSPGAYGNRQGFSLYSTTSQDSSIAQALNSVLYRFVPTELPTNLSTTASVISDIYGANYNDISFKAAAVYAPTNTNYALNYVIGNNYVDPTSGNGQLPYNVHSYGANIGTIGVAALAVSAELGAIDPYMIDLIACTDLEGNLYDHIQLDPASTTVVNSSVTNYAVGGTDGDTSWAGFETLVADWLAGDDHGEFTNLQQHPMTHFSDPGYSTSTKTLLLNMLDLRDNFKIDLATQSISLPANTKAQDISAGQALMFRAQMHPESVINGVGCCRVGIYAHASTLVNGSPYGGLIPFTLNRMIQRRDLDGGTYVKGSSGGFPNSQVTIFHKPNWVADDTNSQALSWSNAINTVRHASRTDIYYASLRTVYPNDTSLLSDDEVSDRIIYMFKICRYVYAKYAGKRQSPKKLYTVIQTDITNLCAAAFSTDNIQVIPTVFQTANDANLGYQVSINLAVSGNLPFRTANFNVLVARDAA